MLAARAPILKEAATQIADPQVRYMGTIGGNVANGDPGNDMPGVMMALDASYVLRGPGGERGVAARDYYQGAYTTAASPGEILTAIRIKAPPAGHGWAYEKLKRKVGDYATAAAAVILTVSGGKIATCAIGLTNVADTALFAKDAAQAVIGTVARQGEPRQSVRRRGGDHVPRRRRPWLGRISHQDGGRHDRPRPEPRLHAREILTEPKCRNPSSA